MIFINKGNYETRVVREVRTLMGKIYFFIKLLLNFKVFILLQYLAVLE